TRTIRNWVSFLEENNCLVKITIAGKTSAYALDPAEVWKGYNTSKPYEAFVTKTLVNSEVVIKRRLQACFGSSEPE
ncbi:helix-turn-helix domain-containing protein, partial [Escherichia coli]|nr:helix-turn-helix domain-containing protein [Escherichia coli]